MEEYYNNNNRGSQIPAFGSWECYDDGLPFTQCFETVHQTLHPAGAAFIHYTYPQDEDLYVAGDLYANDVLTPAMIVVPRRRRKQLAKVEDEKENDGKAGKRWEVVGNFNKEPQINPTNFAPIIKQKKPKPVDEDLYKISPDLLYAKTNKKRSGLSFFSCCGL